LDAAAHRTGEPLAAIRHHYYRGLMKLREFISSNKRSRQPNDAEAIPLEAAHLKPTTNLKSSLRWRRWAKSVTTIGNG